MLKHWLKELILAISKNKFVGVIGLGNMGGGIARNLVNAGHKLLVWDIDEKAVKKANEMRSRINFKMLQIPIGSELSFNKDENIKAA